MSVFLLLATAADGSDDDDDSAAAVRASLNFVSLLTKFNFGLFNADVSDRYL